MQPIVVNERTGHVVGGHQRLQVLMDSGATEADCIVVNLTPEKEKALNLALNKVAGEWDVPALEGIVLPFLEGQARDQQQGGEPAQQTLSASMHQESAGRG